MLFLIFICCTSLDFFTLEGEPLLLGIALATEGAMVVAAQGKELLEVRLAIKFPAERLIGG